MYFKLLCGSLGDAENAALRFDCYTLYPPTTVSFQVRRTEGAIPTGKSFSAFQKL